MTSTRHAIIRGDSRNMPETADESVHLVVTSPPYWQLKDYGSPDQIGFADTYSDYINNLNLVWTECERVLAPGCRLCVNIGDQFARAAYYGRYKVIPIRTEIIRFCEAVGLDYMGAVIWHKVTTTNTSGGASIMGSFPYPRNGILKLNYEFILIFKKQGATPPPSEEAKKAAAMTTADWNLFFSGHWTFPGEKSRGHLAAFPEELPRRLVSMFTFPGETVLDPFMGSGTTAAAAAKLGRNSVAYEINPDFIPMIETRIMDSANDLFSEAGVTVIQQDPESGFDPQAAMKHQPYLFSDPLHKPLKKLRGRPKSTFGSKISGDEPDREEYFKVAEILPDRLVLKDGRILRLLGVAPKPGLENDAREFLVKKIGRGKISYKTDPLVPERDGTTPAYVFLANKTFLNAHLIKAGLADACTDAPYRHKARFIKMMENKKP